METREALGQQNQQSNFFWMGMVSFFTDMASSIVVPLMPFFLVLILDQGIDKLGLVLAITTLVSYLLRILAGIFADRRGRNKPFLILGYGLSAISKPLFGMADGWGSIAAFRSSERLGKAIRSAPKDKLLSASVQQKNHLGKSLGHHKTFEKIGEVLGLLILLATISYFGMSESVFRSLFLASIIPGVLAILVLIMFIQDTQGLPKKASPSFSILLEPKLRGVIAAFVIITLFTFNETFYLLLGNEYGLELNEILMILILVKGTQMLIGKSIGHFVDSYSIKIQLGLGYGAGLCSLLLLLTSTFEAYLASFLLFGIHEIIMLMTIRTFIGKKASDKGTAYGFLYFAIAIFSALSAYVIGLIWQVYGVDTALQVSAIGMLLAGFVLFKHRAHTQ